jgi:GNAT superfamily N-acetyltransferase
MSVEPHAGDDLRRAVSESLDLFNVATTGLDACHAVSIFLRDPDDEIVGGLLGEIWGGWLHVSYLFVAAPFRGRGHAKALLARAERFAIERGCHHARLETFSFQAPGFYAKQGYEIFGTLDDHPPGHRHHFLKKALRAPARARARRALRS